jgi:hypothetical protein
MDSTHSKDSNGILFVKFRITDQKIWFLQDLDQFWFKNSIRICFKSEADTRQNPIGAYRFGWINVVGR